MRNLCQLDELGLSCMGCCGHDLGSKKDVETGLRLNTMSYADAPDKEAWGRREKEFVRSCGICYNLIKCKKEIFCPLHPLRNDGKDLRDDVCDQEHLCKAFFCFQTWSEEKQQAFINFIASKHLDWFSYSVGMDDDSLLKEFEQLQN